MSNTISAETCKFCEVSEEAVEEYNSLLNLSESKRQEAETTHLPWGVPEGPSGTANEHLLHQEEYVVNYDDDLRVPLWVAYRLTRQDLKNLKSRKSCFRSDPRLSGEQSATCQDYDEPIYDRGQMARSNDLARSEAAMINTYLFSNICPQFPNFNREGKPWNELEELVQVWAKDRGQIFLISGAVFDSDLDGQRDSDDDAKRIEPNDRIAIPSHFYKIILFERPNGFIESLTVLLPHTNNTPANVNQHLQHHITTISEIEAVTGINFLPELDEPRQSAVEDFVAISLYPLGVEIFNLAVTARGMPEAAAPRFGQAERTFQPTAVPVAWPVRAVSARASATGPLVDRPVVAPSAQPPSARYAAIPARSGSAQVYLVDLFTGVTWALTNDGAKDAWRQVQPTPAIESD